MRSSSDGFPSVDAPFQAREKRWGRLRAWSDAVICPAFDAAGRQPPACMGVRRPGPNPPSSSIASITRHRACSCLLDTAGAGCLFSTGRRIHRPQLLIPGTPKISTESPRRGDDLRGRAILPPGRGMSREPMPAARGCEKEAPAGGKPSRRKTRVSGRHWIFAHSFSRPAI